MKMVKCIAWILCAGVASACDDSGPFYTARYPVTKVEAVVTVKQDTPEPPEPPATQDQTEIPDPGQIVEIISGEVMAEAPVSAGGSYTTAFTRHDGGTLTVITAPGKPSSEGVFDKQPGEDKLQFTYGSYNYAATIASYTDADKAKRIVLEIDLTKHYQELHPDWNITAVTRREETSARYE